MEQINKVNYTGEGVEVCYTLTVKGYEEEIKEYIKDEPHGGLPRGAARAGCAFRGSVGAAGHPCGLYKWPFGLGCGEGQTERRGARERYDGSHQGGRHGGALRRPYRDAGRWWAAVSCRIGCRNLRRRRRMPTCISLRRTSKRCCRRRGPTSSTGNARPCRATCSRRPRPRPTTRRRAGARKMRKNNARRVQFSKK